MSVVTTGLVIKVTTGLVTKVTTGLVTKVATGLVTKVTGRCHNWLLTVLVLLDRGGKVFGRSERLEVEVPRAEQQVL